MIFNLGCLACPKCKGFFFRFFHPMEIRLWIIFSIESQNMSYQENSSIRADSMGHRGAGALYFHKAVVLKRRV